MESVGHTEEMSKMMKVKLLALAFGFFLVAGAAYAGPLPGGPNADGDSVEDAFDNCTVIPNDAQSDTDHDGCGNFCDADRDQDGTAGISDLVGCSDTFGTACAPYGPSCCDLDGDGVVGIYDLVYTSDNFQLPTGTGPSGITTAQCNPSLCDCP